MKSKSVFLMAVSLGFGLVAAIGITQVMGRSNQPAPTIDVPTLPVLVALQDIDINTELTPEMFKEEEWPATMVPEGVVDSFDQIEGKVITARVGKKGTVFATSLVDRSKMREKNIPAGYKVIGVKMGSDDHLNGLLEPGDLVDLMGVFKGRGANKGSSHSKTFLRKIRIWSIASQTRKSVEQGASAKGSTVVGLLVTEKESEKIMLAQKIGEVKLAMRGSEDSTNPIKSGGTSMEDIDGESSGFNAIAAFNSGGAGIPVRTAPVSNNSQPMQPVSVHTMTVYTGEGQTNYQFNKETGVTVRSSAIVDQSDSKSESEDDETSSSDLDDDDADIDSESLIDDMDSEPNS